MTKGKYVDGYVIPVPKKNKAKYTKMAREGMKVWTRFGALDYKECVIDDAKPAHIAFTFPKMAKVKPGETVWFSFVTYKSRKHRDEVNRKVMAYLEKKYDEKQTAMPFDMKRMAYGGFEVVVSS